MIEYNFSSSAYFSLPGFSDQVQLHSALLDTSVIDIVTLTESTMIILVSFFKLQTEYTYVLLPLHFLLPRHMFHDKCCSSDSLEFQKPIADHQLFCTIHVYIFFVTGLQSVYFCHCYLLIPVVESCHTPKLSLETHCLGLDL